jgi:hypothetical protein
MSSPQTLPLGAALLAGLLSLGGSAPTSASATDPLLSFFSPNVQLSDEQRMGLDRGEAIATVLPGDHHELAIFAAGLTSATAGELVSSVEDVRRLKESGYVPEISRFSNPPRLSDLDSLTLDRDDADAIRECRPGRCDLKLSAAEITRLQKVIATSGNDWRAALQDQFRRMLLDRVRKYVREGDRGDRVFPVLLAHSPSVTAHAPQLAGYLEHYPARRPPDTEAFLYWSKETVVRHPIVSVTHVAIQRGPAHRDSAADALVVSRDVFSSRYVSGALAMTVLLHGQGFASPRYLAYVNHTWADDVYWLWRPIVEHRVKTEAAKAFAHARERIEATE